MAICIPEKSKNIYDFDPRSIPGCEVWFDAADTSTITGSSTVTAWRDKSRNGWNATTLIGTAPTNTTVNGLNAVSFAGQSTLTVSNVTFSSVQSRAIFVVYRVPTSAPNYISWFSTQAVGINNQGGHNNLVYPSGGGGPYLQSYAVGGAVQGMGADAVSTIGTTAIACMIHSAVSTSRNTVTLNGTSYTLSTNTLASGYGSGTVTYYIGNAYPQSYILCEYILYQQEFTVAQRQQVEGYLAHKWLLTNNTENSVASPLSVPGCILWLDAGDPNGTGTRPANGTTLTTWKDKSVSNFPFTSIGSAYNTTAVNGNPGISLSTNFFGYDPGSAQNNWQEVFAVGLWTGGSTFNNYNGLVTSSVTSDGGIIFIGNVGTTSWYPIGITYTIPVLNGTPTYVAIPTIQSPFIVRTFSASSVNLRGLRIGIDRVFTDRIWQGFISEVICYNTALSTTQRLGIEKYLANKWGITSMYSVLPSIHPFSSIKPYLRSFQPTDISGCELWFDGGDSTTMFQNTAGTTPVTDAAQSVACWKDKIRNLSITNTGVPGQSMLAPTSVSGGGVFFNNTSTVVSASAQGLGNSLTGATNQTAFLFRMPTRSMTMITASYPLSNTTLRQICCIDSSPNGAGNVPNFSMGHEIGVGNGGSILFDWDGSNWGQVSVSNSGYNSNTVLRIDSLIADSTSSWLTNGTSNTFSQTNTYTTANTNYPVNRIGMGGYSSTFVGSRNFYGTIYETLLYSKVLSTSERQQVEGYLANKWKLQLSFPATFPFRTLPSSSTLPFLPTNFSRCVLWLDPTDTSTVTLNGSNVSQLNDKSGLGYNMTQATSGNQPTYSTALNGNRMLTFTQASSTRLSNSSFPAFIGSGSASYFLVEYNMTAPSGNPSPFGYSAGPNFGLIMQYNAGFTGGLQPFSTGVSSFTSATPRLIFLYKENVGSTNMIGFINGTSQTVSDTTSGTYSGTFNVGSGPNGFISGNICELIIFNRSLTTAERQQIEGYLAYKWGLQYSLPSTHPYIKFQPPQRSFLLPGTIATVTLSALSGSGGTITWTTSTNAVNYKWFVGTTFPTVLVSGTVGAVLTTAVSFAFVASTNYFAWVIPVSSTESDGATTISSSASYTSGGGSSITSANLNTIATYLRSYMSEFRNPSFYGYNLDGTSYYIGDGGGDMYDNGNMTNPWLISGTQYTSSSALSNQFAFTINYSQTTAATVDTDFIYASLGYIQGSGVSSIHPLTVLGFRSTVGRPVGFQIAGNSGADGGGTLASGILYAGSVLYGFTVHAFYRQQYGTGDPSHCSLFILLGHTNWGSVFGTINSYADPNRDGNGAFFYTSGAGVKDILAVQTLLSKSGGALVTTAECQTVVQAFANRIKLSLGF
jgi:hypothetical protein